jgi:signal transduction histidine kinase
VIPTERFHQHDTAEARLREIALLQQRASALEHCERSAEAALAMARRLVELHGATVEAVNEGEFIVRLPGSPAR